MNKPGETVKEFEKSDLELMGMPPIYDQHYVSDLSDDGLASAYSLLHSEAGKNTIRESDPQVVQLLKAELTMRREFQLRNLILPEVSSEDILNEMYKSIAKMSDTEDEAEDLEKKNAMTTYEGETEPDTNDEHTHSFEGLSQTGNGVTGVAGEEPHSHNVSKFVTLPIVLASGYRSDHPGKVVMKTTKAFKVTKRYEDGFDWESEVDLIKIDLEKQLVGGIVYEPDIVDAQGDSSSSSEIEKACHNYMIKSMKVGKMHSEMIDKGDVALVENFIAPTSFFYGNEFVKKGSWVQVHKVLNGDLWKDIKDEKYTGLSMAGRAKDISPKDKNKSVFEQEKFEKKNYPKRSAAIATVTDAKDSLDESEDHMKAGRTDKAFDSLKDAHSKLTDAAKGMKLGKDHPAMGSLNQAQNKFQHHEVGGDGSTYHLQDAKYSLGDAAGQMLGHAMSVKKGLFVQNALAGGRLGGLVSLLKMDIEKQIRVKDGKFYAYTKNGERKIGGPFDDREDAIKMLQKVEANKHLTARHLVESDIKFEKGGPGSGRHGGSSKKPSDFQNFKSKTQMHHDNLIDPEGGSYEHGQALQHFSTHNAPKSLKLMSALKGYARQNDDPGFKSLAQKALKRIK